MRQLMFWKELPINLPLGEVVNTFRIGDKWADLVPGEMIQLCDADTKEVLHHAIVTSVDKGWWRHLKVHAPLNHAHKGDDEAAAKLFDDLLLIYDGRDGRPRFDQASSPVVVIHFLPVGEEQLKAYGEAAAAVFAEPEQEAETKGRTRKAIEA